MKTWYFELRPRTGQDGDAGSLDTCVFTARLPVPHPVYPGSKYMPLEPKSRMISVKGTVFSVCAAVLAGFRDISKWRSHQDWDIMRYLR